MLNWLKHRLGIHELYRRVHYMAQTQAELVAELTTLKTQAGQIGTDIDELKAKVTALEVAVANAPLSPEAQAALDELKTAMNATDAKYPA